MPRLCAWHHNGPEYPLFSSGTRGVLEARSQDGDQFEGEVSQLVVVQPHALQAIADSVANEIDAVSIEISVEITDESRDVGEEHLSVLIPRHVGKLVSIQGRRARLEYVGAFDGAPNSPLAQHAQHSGVDQSSDMAIEAAGWDVSEFVLKLGDRELAIPQECLENPQANGVQEQVSGRQRVLLSTALSIMITLSRMKIVTATMLDHDDSEAPT